MSLVLASSIMCVSPVGPVDPRTYDDQIIGVSNEVEDNLNFVEFWSQSQIAINCFRNLLAVGS